MCTRISFGGGRFRRSSLALAVLVAAGSLSACSGGRSDRPPPARQAPQIQGLADQSLAQDTSAGPLPFQVSDADSGAERLAVTAQSSDTDLIPAAGLVLGGSGANRTLQITPAPERFGIAMITVRATDPDGLGTQSTFRVQVNGVFVSFRDTVNEVFAAAEADDERSLRGFTFTQDADDDPSAFDQWLQ